MAGGMWIGKWLRSISGQAYDARLPGRHFKGQEP